MLKQVQHTVYLPLCLKVFYSSAYYTFYMMKVFGKISKFRILVGIKKSLGLYADDMVHI
jgi:hypothetical protein